MAGGAQGAGAPAQGGANAFSGSTNPTPYQGSAVQQNLGQNLGQAPGAQGSFGGQNQQAQNNALGAVSAPAGGGQNAMGPNIFGGGTNPAVGGGPYGGFNAQGQNAVDNAQANYNQSGGQGQLTPPQQAAIAQNANPQGGQTFFGVSQVGYTDPAMQAKQQADLEWAQRMNAAQGQGQPAIQAGPSGAYGSGGAQGYAHSGAMQYNPQDQQAAVSAPAFTPQSPMGGFPQQPQGGGPDMSGMTPGSNMGYDQSGSDAGIGGQAVQGVQNPAGMGGKTSRAGGPYGGIMAGRPVMDKGEIPPSLSQMRPQVGGLQIQGNPTAQPFMRKGRAAQQQ